MYKKMSCNNIVLKNIILIEREKKIIMKLENVWISKGDFHSMKSWKAEEVETSLFSDFYLKKKL